MENNQNIPPRRPVPPPPRPIPQPPQMTEERVSIQPQVSQNVQETSQPKSEEKKKTKVLTESSLNMLLCIIAFFCFAGAIASFVMLFL